jgi:hypothetical protein
MDNLNLMILILLLLFTYFVLYFGGRKYLENFKSSDYDNKHAAVSEDDYNMNRNTVIGSPEKAYAMSPINDLDDYEVANVFQNQGSKEASKKQISEAMARYPMDWSVQGPDSQHFQDNQAEFEKNASKTNSINPKMYKDIDGDMIPANTDAMEEEERKILQTYKPQSSSGLLQYSIDDVKSLIDRVFTRKGLIPTIEKSTQGENVWEITEVKEKDPHIVWEDDLAADTERQKMDIRGEEVINVPYTASDLAAGLDPFFQSRNSVRDGKNDYYQWTPGLERMYAPTYPLKSWF